MNRGDSTNGKHNHDFPASNHLGRALLADPVIRFLPNALQESYNGLTPESGWPRWQIVRLVDLVQRIWNSAAFQALVFPILLLGSFMSSWWESPHNVGYGGDVEVHRYVGMLIRRGGIPYIDVVDNKPPIIYLVAATVHNFGPWGMWTFMVVAVALASYVFYQTGRKRGFPLPFVGSVLFTLAMRTVILFNGGGHTRELAACLIFGLFGVVLRRPRRLWLLIGILFTAIFFTQQNETLATMPLIIFLFALAGERKAAFSEFLVGSALVTLPIFGFLVWEGAVWGFIDQAFLFNILYYFKGAGSFGVRLQAAWQEASRLGYRTLYFIFGAFILVTSTGQEVQSQDTAVLAAVLAGFLIQIVSISISGRLGLIYFLPIVPYFVLTIYFGFVSIVRKPWPLEIRALLCAAGVLCVLFIPDKGAHPFHPQLRDLVGRHNPHAIPYKQYFTDPDVHAALRSIRAQRGQFFEMRNYHLIALYTDYDIIAPSKWIYQYQWNGMIVNWDADGREFRGILDSLDRYKTAYVLDCSLTFGFKDAARAQDWETYLKQHYDLIKTGPVDDPWRFYRRIAPVDRKANA